MIDPWLLGLFAACAAWVTSVVGSREVLDYLNKRQFLDHPNARSSHQLPTPRGGGLAVVPAVLIIWAGLTLTGGPLANWVWVSIAGTTLLMVASWADDRHNLPPAPRFLAHMGVVVGALLLLPPESLAFHGWLPLWADRLIAALGWLWFINLFNFMDGIDGLSGTETASLGIGIAAVASVAGVAGGLIPLSLAGAGAGLGFLVGNWHPARVFLGDVGSIPLGFLLGGLLIQLAVAGQLAAAVILPAIYLADATITILRRAAKGEKIWQPHRQHFYQQAVQGGKRHDQVVKVIAGTNLLLIGAAMLAASGRPILGVAGAVVAVTGLLLLLTRWARGRRP